MPIPVSGSTAPGPLATRADIQAELGRVLTSDEDAKADAALMSASDYVRTETRRKFASGTFTVTRRVRDGRVTLDAPSSVTSVVSVDPLGAATPLTDYTLRGNTVYGLGYAGNVEVTYTSDGTVPDDLVRVVAAMAARDITDDTPQGATSYTVTKGPFTESASFDAPTDSVLPTPSEARIIRRFKVTASRSVSLL